MDGQHEIFESLEPDPLDREQVIEGDPQTYDLLLSEFPDGTEVSGCRRADGLDRGDPLLKTRWARA